MDNGHLLGYDNNGYYSASEDNSSHLFGKFKLCKTEACNGMSAINPNDEFRIRDVHGHAFSGGSAIKWLNNAIDGAYLGMTPTWDSAGSFSISKWNPGKYCLAGFQYGLVSMSPALSFTALNIQACHPLELIEVPCDIRAPESSCIWDEHPSDCRCCLPQDISLQNPAERQPLIGLLKRDSVMKALRYKRELFIPHVKEFVDYAASHSASEELTKRFDKMCEIFDLEGGIVPLENNTWIDIHGSFQERMANMLGVWVHPRVDLRRCGLVIYTLMELCREIGI